MAVLKENVTPLNGMSAIITRIMHPISNPNIIEIKDFRYIHYKPNKKNITGIGFTLEKKIMGTCKILSSPDCIPEVESLQPDSGVTNFLFHYEMPLATNTSAYFPSGYPITAIQYLKTNSNICSMFKNMYAANLKTN